MSMLYIKLTVKIELNNYSIIHITELKQIKTP